MMHVLFLLLLLLAAVVVALFECNVARVFGLLFQ